MKYRTIIISIVIIVLLIGGLWFAFGRDTEDELQTHEVTRQSVSQDIEFTGTVTSEQQVTLSFDVSGLVHESPVKLGDHVDEGQLLMALDTQAEALEVAKAYANRVSATVDTKLAVESATSALTNLTSESNRTVERLRQAVRNAKTELDQTEEVWQQVVRESGSESSISQKQYGLVLQARNAYEIAKKTLDETQKTVAKTTSAARETLRDAEAAHAATLQASLTAAGLSALEATEELARLTLRKRQLHAPFAGIVTTKAADKGEFLAAGTPAVTLEDTQNFIVEAQVSEADISQLTVGLPATITLDAYDSNQEFPATVAAIDPSATTIEGVPTYKVTLHFTASHDQLRSGFTTNVTVHVAQKNQVIAIPRRALRESNGHTTVQIVKPDQTLEERRVTVGLSGSDGLIEITSGLSEGERILVRNQS